MSHGAALVTGEDPLPQDCRGGVIAIGNFDGVHRGHQALLAQARDTAAEHQAPFGLVTFEPHPRTFFRPEDPVFRLSPLPLKARLAAALGARYVAALTFDRAFAALEPEAFVRDILVGRYAVAHVVTGYDFHFGRGRKGNAATLRSLGKSLGFEVSSVEQVTDEDGVAPVASSAIRAALRHGNVEAAAHQLGYWWTVLGDVVAGDGRGRDLGYPTANLVLEPGCEPKEGIYAVRVRIDDEPGRPARAGAAYIGSRPTFATSRRFLEVHLLDYAGDLYGRRLAVEFIAFVRPDQAYEGVEPLKRQMDADCRGIAAILDDLGRKDPMRRFPLGALQAEGAL
ncbi:MAG: bifunctional riboflavin kinase/FAD synthetase [Gammaproteobacteria bacterium]